MKEFSENLKRIRTELRKSKRDLAQGIDVSMSTIENWEKGKSLPNLINLFKLCQLLECSCDALLGVE